MNDPLLRPTATRPEVEACRAERRRRERIDAAERCRLALVAALHLPPETTWEEALARVVPVVDGAKGCRGCKHDDGPRCEMLPARHVSDWITNYTRDDWMTPKPGAPECPGRIER